MAPVPEKIPCTTESEFAAHLKDISNVLALPETEDNWEKISRALQTLTALARGGAHKLDPEFVNGVKSVYKPISTSMLSERTRLSGVAIDLLSSLAPRLASRFEPLVPLIIPVILKVCARTNKVFVTRGRTLLLLIIEHCHLPTILPFLRTATQDKSQSLRLAAAEATSKLLALWERRLLDVREGASALTVRHRGNVEDIEAMVKEMARDPNPSIRQLNRTIFEQYAEMFPERVDALRAPLTPTTRRYLELKPSAKQASASVVVSHHAPVMDGRTKSGTNSTPSSQPSSRPSSRVNVDHSASESNPPTSSHSHTRNVSQPPSRPNIVGRGTITSYAERTPVSSTVTSGGPSVSSLPPSRPTRPKLGGPSAIDHPDVQTQSQPQAHKPVRPLRQPILDTHSTRPAVFALTRPARLRTNMGPPVEDVPNTAPSADRRTRILRDGPNRATLPTKTITPEPQKLETEAHGLTEHVSSTVQDTVIEQTPLTRDASAVQQTEDTQVTFEHSLSPPPSVRSDSPSLTCSTVTECSTSPKADNSSYVIKQTDTKLGTAVNGVKLISLNTTSSKPRPAVLLKKKTSTLLTSNSAAFVPTRRRPGLTEPTLSQMARMKEPIKRDASSKPTPSSSAGLAIIAAALTSTSTNPQSQTGTSKNVKPVIKPTNRLPAARLPDSSKPLKKSSPTVLKAAQIPLPSVTPDEISLPPPTPDEETLLSVLIDSSTACADYPKTPTASKSSPPPTHSAPQTLTPPPALINVLPSPFKDQNERPPQPLASDLIDFDRSLIWNWESTNPLLPQQPNSQPLPQAVTALMPRKEEIASSTNLFNHTFAVLVDPMEPDYAKTPLALRTPKTKAAVQKDLLDDTMTDWTDFNRVVLAEKELNISGGL